MDNFSSEYSESNGGFTIVGPDAVESLLVMKDSSGQITQLNAVWSEAGAEYVGWLRASLGANGTLVGTHGYRGSDETWTVLFKVERHGNEFTLTHESPEDRWTIEIWSD